MTKETAKEMVNETKAVVEKAATDTQEVVRGATRDAASFFESLGGAGSSNDLLLRAEILKNRAMILKKSEKAASGTSGKPASSIPETDEASSSTPAADCSGTLEAVAATDKRDTEKEAERKRKAEEKEAERKRKAEEKEAGRERKVVEKNTRAVAKAQAKKAKAMARAETVEKNDIAKAAAAAERSRTHKVPEATETPEKQQGEQAAGERSLESEVLQEAEEIPLTKLEQSAINPAEDTKDEEKISDVEDNAPNNDKKDTISIASASTSAEGKVQDLN